MMIILCACGLFAYLATSRLQIYFQRPKIVSVEVTYTENLPFPAVTICNQNAYRLVTLNIILWVKLIL